MTGLASEASRPPDTISMSRECRSAPSLHEMYGVPAVQPPNRPNEPRISPCNVPTRSQVAFAAKLYYQIRQVGGAIREISSHMNSLHHYAKKTSVKTSAAAFAAKGASDSPRLGGEMLCLFALVALALALRLPNLNESFWYDEIWSTSVMLGSFRSTVYTIIHDAHPPLYHLIMWLWGQLFGDSEVSVRMLPLLAGLASIPLTHLVVRERCGPVAGLIAAGLVTLSPTHIWYSQEARSYALLLALVLTAVWSYDRASTATSPGRWLALFAMSTFAIVFLHYYSIAYVGLLGLFALIRPSKARVRLVAISAAAVLAVGAFVILKWVMFEMVTDLPHLRAFRLFEVWILFFDWFPMGSTLRSGLSPWRHGFADLIDRPALLIVHALLAALFAWGVLSGIRAQGRSLRSRPLDLVALAFAVPLLLAMLTLLGFERITILRSQLSAMPYFFGVLAYGLVSLRPWTFRAVTASALVVLLLVAQVTYRMRYDEWTVYKPNPDWRAAAQYLGARLDEAGSAGAVVTATPATTLIYYDRRFDTRPTAHAGAKQNNKPKSPIIRVRSPELLRLQEVDGLIFFIRNRYWMGTAEVLQERLDAAPDWNRIERHEVKGLEILTYQKSIWAN